jgi:protease I
MTLRLAGRRIAILATDGFEQVELLQPREALEREGAKVEVISPKDGDIQGFNHLKPDRTVHVDKPLHAVTADDFDALVLPGGVANPDQLRTDNNALNFVRAFAASGKPIGAICHAPWILINAKLVKGRRLTSWPTLRLDLKNAGADVVDESVVVDNGLVTGRGPADLPAFCAKIIEAFAETA